MRRDKGFVTRFLKSAALLSAAALVAACAGGQQRPAPAGGQASAPAQPEAPAKPTVDPNAPVLVALLAPTSASGKRARAAAQDLTAAAQMARRAYGPPNMNMKVYDTGGDPARAAVAASQAAAEGAAIIVGPLLGASAAQVGPVAAEAALNVLAFSNDASVAGDNVWVLGQLPSAELARVMGYAASQGVSSVAVAYPTNRYGELIASESADAGRSVGVGVGPYIPYERSFQGIERATQDGARTVLADGATGLLIADMGDALRSAAAFFAYYDVSPRDVKYLGTSRWADPNNSKENALIGGWFAAADPAAKTSFDEEFEATTGRAPSALAGLGYEAVRAAAEMLNAARSAGDQTPFDAAAITDPRGFEGVAGPFRLLPDGRNQRSLAVMEITPEGFEVVDPGAFGGGV